MRDMKERFLAIAGDPRIIPGVHHHCDEWCHYCPVTNRCLVFRCTAEYRREHRCLEGDSTFRSIDDAIAFTRNIAAVEGLATPELDALISNPPGQSGVDTSDPLAALAWDYALHVAVAIGPSALRIASTPSRLSGPEPDEVLLWYHLRIYMRVFRALVASKRTASSGCSIDEAVGSAKLALVSVSRSREALRSLEAQLGEANVTKLLTQLDVLERGICERFPAARSFVRLGLDMPVA